MSEMMFLPRLLDLVKTKIPKYQFGQLAAEMRLSSPSDKQKQYLKNFWDNIKVRDCDSAICMLPRISCPDSHSISSDSNFSIPIGD